MSCWNGKAKKEQTSSPFPWRIFITSMIICGGGSFHFGYQLTVINPTEWIFRQFTNDSCYSHYGHSMSDTMYRIVWSAILNFELIGSGLGTLPLVRLSESLGRRRTFYVTSGFVAFGLLLQALSKTAFSFELLAIGRLLTGFGSGLALGLEPMYFNEISPVDRRGFIGSMTGIFVEFGFLIGGLVGMPATLGTVDLWPYMFVLEIVPVIGLIAFVPFLKESPRYLLARGRVDECREVLVYFGHKDVDGGVQEIDAEIKCQTARVTLREVWQKVYLRKAAYLGTLVALTSAVSGIIAIDFFSTIIFVDVGLSDSSAQYASLGVFLMCFVSAILGGFITDRVGRRALLLVSTVALIVIDIGLMTVSIIYNTYGVKWAGYLSVTACVVFSFAFGCGPSVLQWTVASEMVPQNARSTVQSVAMITQKIVVFTTGMAFFPLQGAIGAYSFFIFIIPMILSLIVFVWKFPETKNKTVVEILKTLGYREEGVSSEDVNIRTASV